MLITFFLFAADTCKPTFLGLIPWYQYLNVGSPPNCDIQHFTIFPGSGNSSDVPLVLVAIIDDLLRIAGMVAVAFVIVGAVKYIMSQGNPEDTSSAQATIINALVGLAITVVAVAMVSFLGNKLGGT